MVYYRKIDIVIHNREVTIAVSEVMNQNDIQESTYAAARKSVINAQKKIYTSVNNSMVLAYWEIGEQIYKACGDNDRAEYGKNILQYLSSRLSEEFGKGFSVQNLRRMRQFYLAFPIRSTLSSELGWSHYLHLMKIDDEIKRNFYAEECVKSGWSVRQLERQINSFFYERLLSSRDKKAVSEEVQKLEPRPEYERIIRDPYVLEFLDLEENPQRTRTGTDRSPAKIFIGIGKGVFVRSKAKTYNI